MKYKEETKPKAMNSTEEKFNKNLLSELAKRNLID